MKINVKRILICASVSINILLASFWLFNNFNANATRAALGQTCNDQEEYRLQNNIAYNQLFYGKWKITKNVPSDIALPSSYTRLNENGKFVGPELTSIIGEEIVFEEEYVEFLGEKHEYSYGPETYSHALLSDNQEIGGYYYAKTLGFTGNYYSIVYFLLPGNYQVAGHEVLKNEIQINDLSFLYLKDDNTIYASNGVVMYRLERIKSE